MPNDKKLTAVHGYVVITPTLCQGDTMAWSETEGSEDDAMPVVFETEDAAWKEIADSLIHELQQFVDGERERDETGAFDGAEDYVAKFHMDEKGNMTVSTDGVPVIEITLEQWRKNR